jgi:hypothetical protein
MLCDSVDRSVRNSTLPCLTQGSVDFSALFKCSLMGLRFRKAPIVALSFDVALRRPTTKCSPRFLPSSEDARSAYPHKPANRGEVHFHRVA